MSLVAGSTADKRPSLLQLAAPGIGEAIFPTAWFSEREHAVEWSRKI
jgi:hypothetical protein